VELLVVIGIIALLISMLLPALNKVRQQAIKLNCASNLRSAGQALFLYAADNKGNLPYRDKQYFNSSTIYIDSNAPWPAGPWPVALFTPPQSLATAAFPHRPGGSLSSYFKSFAVWSCPAVGAAPIDDAANNQQASTASNGSWYRRLYGNYMMFWGSPILTDTSFSTPDFGAYNLGRRRFLSNGVSVPINMPFKVNVKNATEAPLMQDVMYANFVGAGQGTINNVNDPITWAQANHMKRGGAAGSSTISPSVTGGVPGPTPANNPSDSTGFRQGSRLVDLVEGANVLFWDGHVEFMQPGNMYDAGYAEGFPSSRHAISGKGPYR
jgi:prepilin-type processing-associated H-X9-DG protein